MLEGPGSPKSRLPELLGLCIQLPAAHSHGSQAPDAQHGHT